MPGAMTKHILFAPPSIMRSIRYSDTAQGRSDCPSLRLPTGSNSFEKGERLNSAAATGGRNDSPHPVRPSSVKIERAP